MSDLLINHEELEESEKVMVFLKSLTPEMQEKFKTIMWWESLKPKEASETEMAVAVN